MRWERGPARQRGGGVIRGCMVALLVYVIVAVAAGTLVAIWTGGVR